MLRFPRVEGFGEVQKQFHHRVDLYFTWRQSGTSEEGDQNDNNSSKVAGMQLIRP